MAGKKTSSMASKKSEEGSVSPAGSGGGANMGFDFGKLFEAAKIPMVALVVLGIISFFAGLLSLLILPLSALVVLWAGYRATKEFKMDLVNSGLVAALASLVSGIVNAVISLIMFSSGFGSGMMGAGYGGAESAGLIAGVVVVALIIGLVFNVVVAFVLGLVGGFIGQKM